MAGSKQLILPRCRQFASLVRHTCPSLSLHDIMADQIWKEYFILWIATG